METTHSISVDSTVIALEMAMDGEGITLVNGPFADNDIKAGRLVQPVAHCAEGLGERPAAAYVFGIVKNHAFIDGNKRTALITADLFLMLHGYELVSSPAENVMAILGVAEGTMSEAGLSAWIRVNIQGV